MSEVSNRDKKLIIWNFMEEVCEYHQYAVKNNIDKWFKLREFHNVNLLTKFIEKEGTETSPVKAVVDTLKEYAKKTDYFEIQDDVVRLTEKGLDECKKPHHDWG